MLGAVLVALTLAGRAEIADGQIVVRNPSPLGDPNLDEAPRSPAPDRSSPAWRHWTSDDPFMHATQAAVHSAVHHSVHAAVSAAATTSHHFGGSSPGGDSSPSHHHH